MSLCPKFKNKLQTLLKRRLKKYGDIFVANEFEEYLSGIHKICWDFIIEIKRLKLTILLEVESQRPDPVHNLIKTLMWHEEEARDGSYILCQLFDVRYCLVSKPSYHMCSFINLKTKNNRSNELRYYSQNIEFLSVAQNQRKDKEQNKVCKTIADLIEKIVKVRIKLLERAR